MAVTIQSTDRIVASGTAFNVSGIGDTFWLTRDTILATASGTALLTSGNAILFIDGQVFGTSGGMNLSAGDTLVIGETGSVSSSTILGGTGVFLASPRASVVNRGAISSFGSGLVASGGCSLENTGHIYGRSNGVFMGLFGGTGDVLVNTGTITAGVKQNSSQTDIRFFHGVQVEGNDSRIVNHGTILAVDPAGAGVHIGTRTIGGADSVLENYGTVGSANGWGVDLSELSSGTANVFNFGTISGGAGGYLGSDSGDTLVNRGTIQGDISLGLGADTYLGRDGVAVATGLGLDGDDVLVGGSTTDTFLGGTQNDTLRGAAGDDVLLGEADNDLLYGGAGDDSVDGGDGLDRLYGNVGDDLLTGGARNDELFGGAGDDILSGGNGADVLTGGIGADIFQFASSAQIGRTAGRQDQITDFQTGTDKIDLAAIQPGITFIGSGAFSSVAGQVRFAGGVLQGDLDGNGVADFALVISSGTVVAADLILG